MSTTYTAILVDDEPTARDILTTHLSKIDTIEVIASCKNASEAFSVLSKQQVDLVFLDINMPEVTGLMFANAIQGKSKVIFTTAYREYAVDGFDLQAVDYLLKPISLERLMKAVHKFTEEQTTAVQIAPSYDFTFFRCDRKMMKVNFDALLYTESLGDYVKLYTTQEILITRETISTILDKLPKQQFMRTHRSFIINISKIDSFTNEHITIGRASIPISRSYRNTVAHHLTTIK
ncbi:LytTR family DNA-binding domain-containing protein [uncultured Dokdonia sp.]|uniref:LytR/AlgR family response regulator transcription factor n=1 Tax=uncultured Dokdonia sp. TaxID=575653 RepID=UPI0026261A24|nr:LytTR family DNA-binding domain-containing protein [uncultured Dokdonia sp.]